jgi:hypothetical protein
MPRWAKPENKTYVNYVEKALDELGRQSGFDSGR